MRLLLDTHVCVWSAIRPTNLSSSAAEALRDPHNEIFVSAVSAYEIEYKRDRDALLQLLPTEIDDAVRLQGLAWLPITSQHCTIAARLPQHQRDPWDRILVAQAMQEGLQLVTGDHKLANYGVPILW